MWFDKNTSKVYWAFNSGNVYTSSPLTLSYTNATFFNSVLYTVAHGSTANVCTPSIAAPIFMCNVAGTNTMAFLDNATVSAVATDNYTVTYLAGGLFRVDVIKDGGATTKHFIHGYSSVYTNESNFNNVNYSFVGIYNDGLYINVTLAGGAYVDQLINSTGIPTSPAATITITTDKATYQPGEAITIHAVNGLSQTGYLTAYGPTGIQSSILWNTPILANETKTWIKTLSTSLPKGTYYINAATTQSYTPLISQATFSIDNPSNTSNNLSIIWDDFVYRTTTSGTVTTTSNYNISILTVTSPSGIVITKTFPSNSTNYTGVAFDEEGTWTGKITDSGNGSNYKWSNVTVLSGNPDDAEVFDTCTQKKEYVCWDKREYRRGDRFTIYYNVNNEQNTRIIIYDPYNKELYNESLNKTTSFLPDPILTGSIQGSFKNNAVLGDYWVRVKNYGTIIYPARLQAESAAILLAANATPSPTVTPKSQEEMASAAYNLLNIFSMIAFYGFVLLIGTFFGAIKSMTRNGGQVDGPSLVFITMVFAILEALIGLFDPYKMYVIVTCIIILAAYFGLNNIMNKSQV